MKNVIFVLFVLLISCSPVFGQDIEIGKEYDSKKGITFEHWQIASEEGDVFVIQRDLGTFSKKLHIRKLDKNLNLVTEKIDNAEIDGVTARFIEALFFQGELYIFAYKAQNKLSTPEGTYALRIDQNTLEVAETITISATETISYTKKPICVSPDKTKIGIITFSTDENQTKDKFSIRSYEKGLKMRWEAAITSKLENSISSSSKMNNDEEFCISTRVYSKNNEYTTKVTVIRDKGAIQKEYPISVGSSGVVGEVKVIFKENGNVVCAGFYGRKKPSGTIGLFYKEFDKNENKLIKNTTQAFSKSVIDQFNRTIRATNAYKIMEVQTASQVDLAEVEYLHLKQNGEIVLIGEKQFWTKSSNVNGKGYNYSFEYRDIIATTFTPEGDVKWTKSIPKDQSRPTRYSDMSFVAYVENNKLNLLYNVDSKSSEEEVPTLRLTGKNILTLQTSIDENGKVVTQPFSNQNKELAETNEDFNIVPLVTSKEELGDVLLLLIHKKKGLNKIIRIKANTDK